MPGGLGVYSVAQERSAGPGLERQRRLPVLPKEQYITASQSHIVCECHGALRKDKPRVKSLFFMFAVEYMLIWKTSNFPNI